MHSPGELFRGEMPLELLAHKPQYDASLYNGVSKPGSLERIWEFTLALLKFSASRGRGAHHPSADSSSLQFPVVPWILLARHSHGDQRVLGGSPHLGQFCSCEALAKLLDLSKPQLSHLQAFQKQELLLSVKPTSALPMRPTPKPDRV